MEVVFVSTEVAQDVCDGESSSLVYWPCDKDMVPSTIVFLEKHVQEQAVDAGRFLGIYKAAHSDPDLYSKTPARRTSMSWRSAAKVPRENSWWTSWQHFWNWKKEHRKRAHRQRHERAHQMRRLLDSKRSDTPLQSVTMTKTMITRSVNSLYTKRWLDPEGQSAWTLDPPSPPGWRAENPLRTRLIIQGVPAQISCHVEWSWTCIGAGKGTVAQSESVRREKRWLLFCVGLVALVALVLKRFNCRVVKTGSNTSGMWAKRRSCTMRSLYGMCRQSKRDRNTHQPILL